LPLAKALHAAPDRFRMGGHSCRSFGYRMVAADTSPRPVDGLGHVLTYWVTSTEEAGARARIFRPDHAIPAHSFRVEGEWMIITSLAPGGETHDILKIRPKHV
jgi:hypothetical protein